MPSNKTSIYELLEDLHREKLRAKARVEAKLQAFYPPSPRWSLPDPRARYVPNTETRGPTDCVRHARDLAPKPPRWEDP